jgi:hypothetical protein
MDENTFWATFWRALFGAIAAIAISIGGCTANTVYQTRIAIEKGGDPIKIACALTTMTETNCVVATLNSK